MNKKDILEIKKRMKKEGNTFTRLCGCYVNGEREKVVDFAYPFWDIDEEAKYKYLEIANKTLSGKLDNNLLELEFSMEEEQEGDCYKLLMALRESKLKDEGLVNAFYDRVIETCGIAGNYLILLYHDIYDVPLKTSDNMKLDDSEEIYEYIIGAICPVALSKAGLGYNDDVNNISMLKRNWTVGACVSGFTFPCFTERSADVHAVMVYTKDVKNPMHAFWENGLGANGALTSTEKRTAFNNMIKQGIAGEENDPENAIINMQGAIKEIIDIAKDAEGEDVEVYLTPKQVSGALSNCGISEEKAESIAEKYEEYFSDDEVMASELIDEKALRESEIRNERRKLMKEIDELNEQNEHLMEVTDPVKYGESDNPKVILRVSDEKAEIIRTTDVEGVPCILIPLDEDDETIINGRTVKM